MKGSISVNQRVIQWVDERVNQQVNERINQRVIQWVNERVNQQVIQWVNERVNERVNQRVNQWVNERVNQRVNQRVKRSLTRRLKDGHFRRSARVRHKHAALGNVTPPPPSMNLFGVQPNRIDSKRANLKFLSRRIRIEGPPHGCSRLRA
jgi:hypothetical protein